LIPVDDEEGHNRRVQQTALCAAAELGRLAQLLAMQV
jgi:hypothetical protein